MNYARLAATAARLVAANGRLVTLVKLNTTPANPAAPWEGPADPRAGATSAQHHAVFVEPDSLIRLGESFKTKDFIKNSHKIAIVGTSADLEGFEEILDDDGKRWRILGMEKLRPATITLAYFIGVAHLELNG